MKKNTYRLKNIDCAACALKIEDGVNKLEGVESSSLNFMLLKFFVTFDDKIKIDFMFCINLTIFLRSSSHTYICSRHQV